MGCTGAKAEPAKQPTKKQSSGSQPLKPKVDAKGGQNVMGKFRMFMTKEDIMGEGTSSICRRGINIQTNEEVAIKVYKDQKAGGSSKVKQVTMQKFKRQIAVLKELQEDFKQPSDPTLWNEQLASVKPSRVFMQLLDHSKDKTGQPGPDATDGFLYVVTELAQYSLKDFLANMREKKKPLSKDAVRNITKAIVIAMAGLHAKGFVHIDMKPENMMMFNGRLKVIDVDGCVRIGTKVSIQDSSISFSPCYCAPEWARFLISENDPCINISPALDVWSVGMTLCELVTFDAILKPQYANFLRNAHSHREASFLFMEWLGGIKKAPVPKTVDSFDRELMDLIQNWMLVCNKLQRKSFAQCLANKYIQAGAWEHEHDKKSIPEDSAPRIKRNMREDQSVEAPLYKGTLFKLNSTGDPKKADQWIQRDFWIAHNHSLCYFSQKEEKRLVLIDGSKISTAHIEIITSVAREFAFTIKTSEDNSYSLAAESQGELNTWLSQIKSTGRMDMTFQLGERMAEDLQAFKMTVRNRRQKVVSDAKDQFEPAYKAKLWKLKGDGDSMRHEDWFERDMWISKNGSLVYWSPKEDCELVYYTAADVSRGKIVPVPEGKACKPYAFQLALPAVHGVEFAPGEFAAESEELRRRWVEEFQRFM